MNVVFQVPQDIAREAIRLSQSIGSQTRALLVLDSIEYHPHITIYSPEYPQQNIDQLLHEVNAIAGKSLPFALRLDTMVTEYGYVAVQVQGSPDVSHIHAEAVKKLNPLREGHMRKEDQQGLEQCSPAQRINITQYGSPNVMGLYRPHLTLSRLANSQDAEKAMSGVIWCMKEFTVTSLAAYEMGDHGSCRTLIKDFPLSAG